MATDDQDHSTEAAAQRAARKAARRAELAPDPNRRRGQRRAAEQAIRDEACTRLHDMVKANRGLHLVGLDSALLDLSIDISTCQPGALAVARALLGNAADIESETDDG